MADEREPILSVLVPTYNGASFIGDAIRSVLDQGAADLELIVVDDGSTDGTEDLLRPLIQSGAIHYLWQRNSGPSAARNLAMATARGRFLMFLDADDSLMPGYIAATLDFLERNPEVDLFFTNYDIVDETGIVSRSGVDTWKVFRNIPHRETGPDEWVFTESLAPHIIEHGAFMSTSGLTVRRAVAESVGPFKDGYFYAEDDEFYARVAHHCTAGYIDRVLSRVRHHSKSLIHDTSNQLRKMKHLLELTEIQLDDYRDDRDLQRILRQKVRKCAQAYSWCLIENGSYAEARAYLRKYLSRYPFYWPYYKSMAKAVLLGLRSSR